MFVYIRNPQLVFYAVAAVAVAAATTISSRTTTTTGISGSAEGLGQDHLKYGNEDATVGRCSGAKRSVAGAVLVLQALGGGSKAD